MNGLSNELLARAGLAFEQDGRFRGRDEFDLVEHVRESWGVAHNSIEAVFLVEALVQDNVFGLDPAALQCALDQDFQLLQAHWLRQKIEGSTAHRFDSCLHVAVSRHHDADRTIGQRDRTVDHLEA